MEYNKNRICLSEGKAYMDGVEVLGLDTVTITSTPTVKTHRECGETTPSSRITGWTHTVTVNGYRATPWFKEMYNGFMKTKATKEFTIQAFNNDENSDYYEKYGAIKATAVGCVLTSAINIVHVQGGDNDDYMLDQLTFNAKEVIHG